jgi:hypothetical protein
MRRFHQKRHLSKILAIWSAKSTNLDSLKSHLRKIW